MGNKGEDSGEGEITCSTNGILRLIDHQRDEDWPMNLVLVELKEAEGEREGEGKVRKVDELKRQ